MKRRLRVLIWLLCPLTLANAQEPDLQSRIDAACKGPTGTFEVPSGRIRLSTSLKIPSLCRVQGEGVDDTVLIAAPTLAGDLIVIQGQHHIVIEKLSIDGARFEGGKAVNAITIQNSEDIRISAVRAGNVLNAAILIRGSGKNLVIENSRLFNSGQPLPSPAGAGFAISPGDGPVERVSFVGNQIYGNNQGIAIFNSPIAAYSVDGILIRGNKVFGNADEGISANSANTMGGQIRGIRIINNQSFCNGWPAGGAGFSTKCEPQLLQRGSTASSSGVGIDLIGGQISEPEISNNQAHDNVFDGISTDGRRFWIVSTAGKKLLRVSGSRFDKQWPEKMPVAIDDKTFLLDSVRDSTSLMVTASAGTQKHATLSASSPMGGVIQANRAFSNGVGKIGAGIWNEAADHIRYNENYAANNQLEGFGCSRAMSLKYKSNRAVSNNRGGETPFGFSSRGCAAIVYFSPSARDGDRDQQRVGIFIDKNSNRVFIAAPSIRAKDATIKTDGQGTTLSEASPEP